MKRPTREQLIVPDDIGEARKLRAEIWAERAALHKNTLLFDRITSALIDRQGKNHYIELLYGHGYRRDK